MIVKLSLLNTDDYKYLIADGELCGYILEFRDDPVRIHQCEGFNYQLGFKMRYHVDEREDEDNYVKIEKEI